MQVKLRFCSVPPEFRGRTPWGGQGPPTSLPLPPTTREDLRLEFPIPQRHFSFTNFHVFIGIQTAPQLASLTTIPVGRHKLYRYRGSKFSFWSGVKIWREEGVKTAVNLHHRRVLISGQKDQWSNFYDSRNPFRTSLRGHLQKHKSGRELKAFREGPNEFPAAVRIPRLNRFQWRERCD
ncbi:hypothetical protein TNCV_4519731 [Trichonephila clavipes]|nr:hypothetical protein TNCV_4519731 [Trichonephila clavipes]